MVGLISTSGSMKPSSQLISLIMAAIMGAKNPAEYREKTLLSSTRADQTINTADDTTSIAVTLSQIMRSF